MSAKNQSPSLLQRMSDEIETARVSEAAPGAEPSRPELPEIDQSTTGVVFVHGIGEQVRAEILLGWSLPIVRSVADWAASRGTERDGLRTWSGDRVVRTGIDFEGSDLPLVTIRVPGTTEDGEVYSPQTWVLTEARWAQDVRPPTLETMIDWCGPRGVVGSVVNRIVARSRVPSDREADPTYREAAGKDARADATRALAEMGLSAFVSVVVTLGLLIYAVVQAVAGIIPYKPLQDALARISLDTFLTTWWGDVFVLLDDPVQAANIRGQVAKSIRALRAFGCRRIVVVAHSGGTIVSYMTLSDPALTESADTLVTHGQAIEMGRIIHAEEGSDPTSPGSRIAPGAPLRVTRWHDFHATHDPAPAGQLSEADPAKPRAPGLIFKDTEVWNRMSIADDHGGYFDNDEEFVDRLLSEIETAGRPGVKSRFQPGRHARRDRRRQRVFVLALWKRLMFVIPVIAIMTAFLTESQGLIPDLGAAAGSIAAFVPGSSELFQAIRGFVPTGFGGLVTASATVFAVLYMLAIVQALMPIGRSRIWDGWRRWVFRFLDMGVVFLGFAIAVVVRAVEKHDPAAGVTGLVVRLGDAPLLYGSIIVAILFLVLFISPVREGIARNGVRYAIPSRLLVVGGGFAIIAVAIYGLIVDDGIRTVVAATVVAMAIFQVLGKVGTWRWERWDEAERAVARSRSAVQFQRRWVWVEFLALGAVATVVAVAIGIDQSELLRHAAIALALILVALIIADVVVRKPAPRSAAASATAAAAGSDATAAT